MHTHSEGNFCEECKADATEELDGVALCAQCFLSLIEMFDAEELKMHKELNCLVEEGDLHQFLMASSLFG